MSNIYLASSWRNRHQPTVLAALRGAGHKVYDFRNPAPDNSGFSWRQIRPDLHENLNAEVMRETLAHPVAREGFGLDFDAMRWADTCVLLLPCGRSAHLEAGWFAGAGKRVIVLAPSIDEPELMYKCFDVGGATPIFATVGEVIEALGPELMTCPKCGGGGTRPHDGFGMLAHVRPAFPNAPPETPQQEDRMSHTDQPHPSLCPACGGLPIDPPLEGAACSTCGRAGSAWAPSADLLGAQPINAAELVAELVAAAPQLQDAIDARAAEVANPAPTVAEELARLAKEIAMSEAAAGCMIILIHPSGGMEFGTVAQAGPAAKLLSDIHRGTIAITQGAPVPGGDPQCHACQGSKRIAGRICLACGGKGTIPKATAPVVHRG